MAARRPSAYPPPVKVGEFVQAPEAAEDERAEVTVLDLADKASLQVSVWAPDEPSALRLESELRLKAHQRLREAGVFA